MNAQHLAQPHLTQLQITDSVVAGEPTPACRAHVATCSQCRDLLATEMQLFSNTVNDFNHASLAWAEARPSTSLRARTATHRNWAYAPMAWTLAAATILFAGVPFWQHQHPASIAITAIDSDTQIAQDNRLLENVNLALVENDPSPLTTYQLDETTP